MVAGSVYSTSERNYETFNKIQAKSIFGRHVGGQEYALQNRLRAVSLFSWSVEQIARDTPLTSNMAANTNHSSLEKSTCHKISLLNMLPLKFPL